MSTYILRKLLLAIPTFFGVTIIAFLIMLAAPGDPIDLITFNPTRTDPAATESLRRKLGLDQPPLMQYVYWLIGNDWTEFDVDGDGQPDTPGERKGVLRGDFGQSLKHRRPVSDLIREKIPATLLLTFSALILGYSAGIALGVFAAVYHRTWIDQTIRIFTVVGNAMPQFWLGLLLIILFSVNLGVLPMSGMRDITNRGGGFAGFDILKHMIMPVFVLSLSTVAFISRFTRTELLDVLAKDYVRTANAKGLANSSVWWLHALPNALIPVATFLGPALGTLLAGAVIVEKVFNWPGMGRMVVDAVFNRDYPLVMGSVVIAALMYIIGLLISDILYTFLDPRVRLR
ncbi:MAG: ABC transporter permease [Caldilineaceae bacterium]|nr:ABC transporter permease [Caldilineaceae bacterium]MCB9138023.1 ABC transporter permease [Caldilineaceae bacterium]